MGSWVEEFEIQGKGLGWRYKFGSHQRTDPFIVMRLGEIT